MKIFFLKLIFVVIFFSFFTKREAYAGEDLTNVRLYFNGNFYSHNETVYVPCGSLTFTAQLLLLDPATATYSARYRELSMISEPQNWGAYPVNENSTILCYVYPGFGGNFTVNYTFTNGANQVDYANFTLHVKQGPTIDFNTIPQLYGANQSGVINISIPDNNYNTITWTTSGGLTVNGTTSYTGIVTNATVNTSNWGGRLTVSAVNNCGTGMISSVVIGTPYISHKLLNGNPSQNLNYVTTDAQLLIITNSTATSCSWEIDGGTGNIYPYSFSCLAFPNNFLRVRAQTSNQYGNGESYVYYIMKEGYSGYRMVYPNPTNDKLNIEFDNSEVVEYLLNEIILFNDKAKEVRRFDLKEANSKKYFRTSKNVTFDVKDLEKGTYYLHIFVGDKIHKERIIIN